MIAEIKLSQRVADNFQNTKQKDKNLGKQGKDNYRNRPGLQYQYNSSRKENKENYVEGKNELIQTGDSSFRVISKGQGTAQFQNLAQYIKGPRFHTFTTKIKRNYAPNTKIRKQCQ